MSLQKVCSSSSPPTQVPENPNRALASPSQIDCIFQKFKQRIQDIPIKELPLKPEDVEFVKGLIDKYKLDPNLQPTIADGKKADHPKVQELVTEFSQLELKEKIVLMQYLSNARYENHEIYYFLPSFLLSQTYPMLKEYINYREPSLERVLTPKGIRFAVDLWKSKGKISSQIECIVCEDPDALKKEFLQKASESAGIAQKLFLVQMDQTESLRGDHTVPIFFNKESPESEEEVIITDSTGTAKKYLDAMGKFVHSLLPKADIRGFAHPRQTNSNSCLLFSLNDVRVISQNPQKFLSFIRSQEPKSVQDAPYKTFETLPDEMMKLSQTSSMLKIIFNENNSSDLASKLRRKGFLIMAGDSVDQWRQKGCLITDQQLSKSTNVYANHLFAKVEHKILEKVFA